MSLKQLAFKPKIGPGVRIRNKNCESPVASGSVPFESYTSSETTVESSSEIIQNLAESAESRENSKNDCQHVSSSETPSENYSLSKEGSEQKLKNVSKFKPRPGPKIDSNARARKILREPSSETVMVQDVLNKSESENSTDAETLLAVDRNRESESKIVTETMQDISKVCSSVMCSITQCAEQINDNVITSSVDVTNDKTSSDVECTPSLIPSKFKKRPGPNLRQIMRTQKSVEDNNNVCSIVGSEMKSNVQSDERSEVEEVAAIDRVIEHIKEATKEEKTEAESNSSPVVLISETTPVFLEEEIKIIGTSDELTDELCDKPSLTEEDVSETSLSLIVQDNSSANECRNVSNSAICDQAPEVEVRSGKVNKSKTLTTGPRLTVKPKVTAIDKLKRPSKFTTSTYGKMSFEVRQSMQKKFGNGTPDLSKMTMMDLIFYNPDSNPMTFSSKCENLGDLNSNSQDAEQEKEGIDNNQQVISENDDAMPVPRLTLSADGKVVVSQESLKVKQTKSFLVDNTLSSAKKTKRTPDRQSWSFEDTVKFYKALKTIGSDFEMMKSIFPDRSRKCLKSKFKREERLNGCLIDKVMTRHSEYDLQSLEKELEEVKEFKEITRKISKSGPTRKKGARGPSTKKKCALPLLPEDKDSPKKRPQRNTKRKQILADDEEESTPSKMVKTSKKPISKLSRKSEESEGSEEEENLCRIVIRKNRKKGRMFTQRHLDMVQSMLNSDGLMTISSSKVAGTPRICFRRKVANVSREKNGKNKNENTEPAGNRIVINTNIDFDNVKYTKSVSYDPNNLENPLDINETIAH